MILGRRLSRLLSLQATRPHVRNMAHIAPHNPLIAVVGATGTGKSELAIELASRFNGEIINGDAMQMYQGLPIITNQIPESERKGIPHHLLGNIGLGEDPWTVGSFVKRALEIIAGVKSRGKIPILVGGTHYYTQSLLFENTTTVESRPGEELTRSELVAKYPILEDGTQVMYDKLMEIDPVMANRWHPNERRKIQRSLEIYLTTGRKASDIYDEQRQSTSTPDHNRNGNNKRVRARFESLVFWIHVPRPILNTRLDNRVHRMLESGLLSELETMSTFLENLEEKPDKSYGIWQAIGYHEFQDYQVALASESNNLETLERMKMDAVEQMKAHNRQYARRQLRWIQSKLLSTFSKAEDADHFFLLDGSDLTKWQQTVLEPAFHITKNYLQGTKLPKATELSTLAVEMLTSDREDLATRPDLWTRETCELCRTIAVTPSNWKLHLESNRHRKALKKLSRNKGCSAESGKEESPGERRAGVPMKVDNMSSPSADPARSLTDSKDIEKVDTLSP
jgi:tRNA dimethylallyltransferase